MKTKLNLLLAIFLVIIAGCSHTPNQGVKAGNEQAQQEDYCAELLDLNDIKLAFQKEGLELIRSNSEIPEAYVVDDLQPEIFNLGQLGGKMYIYIFPSFNSRRNVLLHYDPINAHNKAEEIYKPYTLGRVSVLFQEAKNAIIVYIPEADLEIEKKVENREVIEDIIFNRLNNGEKIVFTGKSDSWKARYAVKYYNYFWESNGIIHYDSGWTEYQGILLFKGAKPNDVGEVRYLLGDKASGSLILDDRGTTSFASSAGNGGFSGKDETYKLILKWDGNTENMELKAEQL